LTIAIRPQLVEVPDLTGFTITDAETELAARGLELGEKIPTTSDTVEPGRIADQDPAAGTEVPEDTLVTVYVVEGPASVTLGDYTCLTFGKANSEIRKVGLVAEFAGTATPLPQCPNPNFVALQDPAAGAVVEPGSTVLLYTGSESSPTATASPT
jgi:eukaryotic-like serine/threonine-protein kinase